MLGFETELLYGQEICWGGGLAVWLNSQMALFAYSGEGEGQHSKGNLSMYYLHNADKINLIIVTGALGSQVSRSR